MNTNKAELVKNGVISQELSDHMSDMYPHYVPIGRINTKGNAIDVPLDTGKTGVDFPIKSAKGGSNDILPLFDTIAQRTLQTYRASARNNFGIELKNTLNTIANTERVNVDNIIDTMGQTVAEQGLLQEGKNGNNPTFTVFENGEKITYEITKDMYDALKPVGDSSILGKTIKPLNKISNFRRGVLTEYNPLFMITNAIKDAQDVLINSQHSAKTYSKFPEAYTQIIKKGYWYQEYVQNGGEQNSYFNANDSIFESDVKQSRTKSMLKIPLDAISNINNVIELAPRLSEYIASRESERSIETSMLDASRVTTNFKAVGDVTKFANRNGATFLNAIIILIISEFVSEEKQISLLTSVGIILNGLFIVFYCISFKKRWENAIQESIKRFDNEEYIFNLLIYGILDFETIIYSYNNGIISEKTYHDTLYNINELDRNKIQKQEKVEENKLNLLIQELEKNK